MTGRKVATEPEHSEIGPSGISSIILCPGKVRLCRGIERQSSFAASQGTVAHGICEKLLNGKKAPKIGTIIKQEGFKISVDKEMIESCKMYLDHVGGIRDCAKQFGSIEETVEKNGPLEFLGLPELFGTADYSLSVPFHTLYIRDFKYGSGVVVDAENNEQLMCYALIAGQELFETYEVIDIGIVQPRAREGELIKIWRTTPKHILNWAENVLKPTVKLALSDDAPLVPGDKQCMWCAAKGVCPALAKTALTIAQADFAEYADFTPDKIVDTVSIDRIAEVYHQLPLLKQFIKAVEARVFNELSIGNLVEGLKLVAGRRSRNWVDEFRVEHVLKELGVDPYITKLVSPAQAEKLVSKDEKAIIKGLVEYTDGSPTITTSDDKRQAITSAIDDFKDFTD